jgi:hypothetical protein
LPLCALSVSFVLFRAGPSSRLVEQQALTLCVRMCQQWEKGSCIFILLLTDRGRAGPSSRRYNINCG